LLVADNSAEHLIMGIGSALPLDQGCTMDVRGRNLKSGLPEALEVSSVELHEIMKNKIHWLVSDVSAHLTPDPNLEWGMAKGAELRGTEMLPILIPKPLKPALRESYVTLTGGFASRIKKLDQLLTQEVGVPFVIGDPIKDEPLNHTFFAPDLLDFDE
jgi:actin-like ATPase involved in cell morphogenesis